MAHGVRVVVLFWLLWSSAAPAAELRKQSTFVLRVVAFDRTELFYRPRAEAPLRAIPLYTSAPSAPFHYTGPHRLELLANAAGEEVAAVVEFLPDIRRALIVLPPAAGDGREASPVVIPDDLAAVPLGTLTLINAAGRPYEAEYGAERRRLPAGAQGRLLAAGESSLILHAPVAGTWRRVTRFDLTAAADARSWIVLLPPYRVGELQPRLRLLVDQGE